MQPWWVNGSMLAVDAEVGVFGTKVWAILMAVDQFFGGQRFGTDLFAFRFWFWFWFWGAGVDFEINSPNQPVARSWGWLASQLQSPLGFNRLCNAIADEEGQAVWKIATMVVKLKEAHWWMQKLDFGRH